MLVTNLGNRTRIHTSALFNRVRSPTSSAQINRQAIQNFHSNANYNAEKFSKPSKSVNLSKEISKLSRLVEVIQNDPTLMNIKDELGRTPLHLAIKVGSEDIVKFLLNNGANPYAEDKNGLLPIFGLFKSPLYKTSILSFYIMKGFDVNASSPNGRNLLSYTIKKGDLEGVKALLKNGADCSVLYEGLSPLYQAVHLSRKKIVEFLLDQGVLPNPKTQEEKDLIRLTFNNSLKFEQCLWILERASPEVKKIMDHEREWLARRYQ